MPPRIIRPPASPAWVMEKPPGADDILDPGRHRVEHAQPHEEDQHQQDEVGVAQGLFEAVEDQRALGLARREGGVGGRSRASPRKARQHATAATP